MTFDIRSSKKGRVIIGPVDICNDILKIIYCEQFLGCFRIPDNDIPIQRAAHHEVRQGRWYISLFIEVECIDHTSMPLIRLLNRGLVKGGSILVDGTLINICISTSKVNIIHITIYSRKTKWFQRKILIICIGLVPLQRSEVNNLRGVQFLEWPETYFALLWTCDQVKRIFASYYAKVSYGRFRLVALYGGYHNCLWAAPQIISAHLPIFKTRVYQLLLIWWENSPFYFDIAL